MNIIKNILGMSCFTLISLGLFVTSPVFAAATGSEQRLPGVVDRPAESITPESLDEDKRIGLPPIPASPDGSGVTNPDQLLMDNLTEVIFSGHSVVDEMELQTVVAPFLGQSLSAANLAELKYAVDRVFYDKGYVLTKSITPPQDVSDGILEVQIYEARIGDITIEDNGVVSPYILEQITRRVESGDIFQEMPVESMANDTNDLHGVGATINLRPGSQVGTTDLALIVEPRDDDVQRFTIDNYGSELTGDIVGQLQLEKSNLLGLGENLRFTGRRSDGDLWSVLFGATVPIGYRNVFLDFDFLHSENEIEDRLSALGASGETDYFGLGFTSSIINQRSRKLNVRAGFNYRNTESFLLDVPESKDKIRQLYAEANYTLNWDNTVGYASLRLTKGIDVFNASDDSDLGTSRLGGDAQATRLMPLIYIGHRLTENGLLKALFVGQWASNTLLASDMFVIGGYGSVRGFEPGTETGEKGIQVNLEYQHKVYSWDAWNFYFGPFLDAAKVYNEIDFAAVDDSLVSVGLGLEITGNTSLWQLSQSSLRFDWAHTVGDYTSTLVEDNTFYFRFSQAF